MEAPRSSQHHGGKAYLVGAAAVEKTKPLPEILCKAERGKGRNTLASSSLPSSNLLFKPHWSQLASEYGKDSLQGKGREWIKLQTGT